MIGSDEDDSNTTWCNELQRAQSFPSSLMDRGMRIESNDEQLERVSASIRASFDPESDVNDERE
jgi:hypothetical protein